MTLPEVSGNVIFVGKILAFAIILTLLLKLRNFQMNMRQNKVHTPAHSVGASCLFIFGYPKTSTTVDKR